MGIFYLDGGRAIAIIGQAVEGQARLDRANEGCTSSSHARRDHARMENCEAVISGIMINFQIFGKSPQLMLQILDKFSANRSGE